MADVPIVETFPKITVSKSEVEAERNFKLTLHGVKSSTVTEDDQNWILTTVFAGPDDPTPPISPSDDVLKSALRTALRLQEIGDKSPYEISFAQKGRSGATFGFMQGDMSAEQPVVQRAFHDALAGAGISEATIARLAQSLSGHLVGNPLNPQDTKLVNDALNSETGQAQVNAMDESIFEDVCQQLDKCIGAASQSSRTIMPKAKIYMALWINMTGPPTILLTWLSGQDVTMAKRVPKPDTIVDAAAMEDYLRATFFFDQNPGNFPHITQSAAAGANVLADGNLGRGAAPDIRSPVPTGEPSGVQWCSRFPGSKSVSALVDPFKTCVQKLLAAMHVAAPPVSVTIDSTFRPPERAYLMHFAWQIAHGEIAPADVPPKPGVNIIWAHPNGLAAAKAMVKGYGMVFPAALLSNHEKGLAIDMDLAWSGNLSIEDDNGAARVVSTLPRDGMNSELQRVAATYGVLKLASDPGHWSVDGT
jgi:hypothetical protein